MRHETTAAQAHAEALVFDLPAVVESLDFEEDARHWTHYATENHLSLYLPYGLPHVRYFYRSGAVRRVRCHSIQGRIMLDVKSGDEHDLKLLVRRRMSMLRDVALRQLAENSPPGIGT